MLKKIKSTEVLENIFQFIKVKKLIEQLFSYSKYFQKITLSLFCFQKEYLKEIIKKEMNESIEKNNTFLKKYITKRYDIVSIDDEEKKFFKCFLCLNKMKEMKVNPPFDGLIVLDDTIQFILKIFGRNFVVQFDVNKYKNKKYYNSKNKINANDEDTFIENESRIINLIDEIQNIIYIHFVYNGIYLEKIMKLRNFNSYYLKSGEFKELINDSENTQNLNDLEEKSWNSMVSIEDFISIFSTRSIIDIYKYNFSPILSEENFNKKYSESQNFLSDLSNNSKYYYKNLKKKFIYLDEYYDMAINVYKFTYSKSSSIMYLFGPKGSSKSTFFLYSKYPLSSIYKVKYLYLDVKCLQSKNIIEIKKIISHELLYLFEDINEMNMVVNKKIFHDIAYQEGDFLLYLYIFLEKLFQIFKESNNKKIRIIIIDNIWDYKGYYKESIKNIIQLIGKYQNIFKLILCGNGYYFNKKFIELYKKNSINTYKNKENAFLLSIDKNKINAHIKQSDEFFKSSLKFNYLYNANEYTMEDFKKKIISEEQQYLNGYNFYGLFFCDELNGKTIPKDEIIKDQRIYYEMPLDYFEIIIKDDKSLNFTFFHSVYRSSIKKKIGYEVKRGTLTSLLKDKDYPRTFFGVCFEKKVTLLLMNNQLKITNLFFEEENIKEIYEISMLKESDYKGPIFNVKNKDKSILLLQENFFGPNYDLLIISSHNNNLYASFVQIGTDKDKSAINKILKDLKKNEQNYKNNIVKAFELESQDINITLVFIFDYDTQRLLNYSSGAKICFDKKINYYLFSNDFDYLLKYDHKLNELSKCDIFDHQYLE